MTSPTLTIEPVVSPSQAPYPHGSRPKTYGLPLISVPEDSGWWSSLQCYMHTGTNTVRQLVEDHVLTRSPQRIAMDIETHGVDEGRFSITCVTAAFRDNAGQVHTVLVDPLRRDEDMSTLRMIVNHASSLVFHNATFDIPALYGHGILTRDDIDKVEDTILLSRLIHTNRPGGRTLEELAGAYGVGDDTGVKIEVAMKAAGFATKNDGFNACDIDNDFYRRGAMADTAVTLKLWDPLFEEVMDTIVRDRPGTNNPRAFLSTSGALHMLDTLQRSMRVNLRASARGIKFDDDYAEKWIRETEEEMVEPAALISNTGLRYNVGADVVVYLDKTGELPDKWPRTETGKLKSDKKALAVLEKMGHRGGVAGAHAAIAKREKEHNYFKAMATSAWATGRVHTSLSVLGAAASGRMSANSPAVQQFSDAARRALICDTGDFWSVDWSSIEPVVLSNAAGDTEFITPFNNGHDLYVPTAQKAGLIPADLTEQQAMEFTQDEDGEWDPHPGRKKSKTMLLAQMYGQGLSSLADANGWEEAEAAEIADGMRSAMAPTFAFMDRLRATCREANGFHNTLMGRVLEDTITVTNDFGNKVTKVLDRVAVNHFCQGSAADVLYDTIARLDRMGMGDHVHMPVHDEIITDDEGVEAVKEVMSTPPEWLVEGAQTDHVVLRIDAKNIGPQWRKA